VNCCGAYTLAADKNGGDGVALENAHNELRLPGILPRLRLTLVRGNFELSPRQLVDKTGKSHLSELLRNTITGNRGHSLIYLCGGSCSIFCLFYKKN
jgi:hypothetical protein